MFFDYITEEGYINPSSANFPQEEPDFDLGQDDDEYDGTYGHKPREEMEVWKFTECQIADFDQYVDGEFAGDKQLIRSSIQELLNESLVPCILEETTNGFHAIILDKNPQSLKYISNALGFDYVFANICADEDDHVLRTRRKPNEERHFIFGREYFHLEWAKTECLLEYLRYSDKVLANAEKRWDDEVEWDDSDTEF
jgi:hypothetical protein